jgi:hypothetical protein
MKKVVLDFKRLHSCLTQEDTLDFQPLLRSVRLT